MRRIAGLAGILALLSVGPAVRADDDAKLREVVAKAIKAHGGADNLKKLQASVTKTKGKFYGLGGENDYTGEASIQLPNRFRMEFEGKFNDTDIKVVQVANRDKGWFKLGDDTTEMSKEMLEEIREELNVANVTQLVVLTGKEYKLSSLGDLKVGDHQTIGVRAEREGYRPINLFFDKESGLLVKTETRGKDIQRGGEEYTSETEYSDFKKVQDVVIAHKLSVKHDGKRFVDSETTDVKLSEKLENNVFEKP
jgi:outer membrane lipoprotein-sorting protein